MVEVRKIGTPLLFFHGVFMLSLGLALFMLSNSMTNPSFEAFGYILAVILVSGSLPAVGWISYRGGILTMNSGRAGRMYLLAGAMSIAIGAMFWISQLARAETHALPILTGFYGMYWGLWNFGLALHLPSHSRVRTMLCIFGGMAAALSVILATEFQFSYFDAVTAMACYLVLIGIQGLGIFFYFLSRSGTQEDLEISSEVANAEHVLVHCELSVSGR